jgi:TonB family protein
MLISLALAAAQAAEPVASPPSPPLERPRYAAPPPPPPPPPPPRGRFRPWPALLDRSRSGDITDDDYPAGALARAEEGIVAVRLSIDAAGLITGCAITSSSGHAELDAATCRLTRERFRFRPARNAKGKAVPDTISTRLVWRLAEAAPPPLPPLPAPPGVVQRARILAQPDGGLDYPAAALRLNQQGRSALILEIGADGRVANCIVRQSSGHGSLDEAACAVAMKERFKPGLDAAGRPVGDVYPYAINWRIRPPDPVPATGSTSPPSPPR